MDNHQFLDKLANSPSTLWTIVLCNILDGLDADLYKADFVKQAMEWWRVDFLRLKSEDPDADEDDLMETALSTLLLKEVVSSSKPVSPKPDFRMKYLVNSSLYNCCNSLLAESFLFLVVHEDDRRRLLKDGLIRLRSPVLR
jgi:hypothetical protein